MIVGFKTFLFALVWRVMIFSAGMWLLCRAEKPTIEVIAMVPGRQASVSFESGSHDCGDFCSSDDDLCLDDSYSSRPECYTLYPWSYDFAKLGLDVALKIMKKSRILPHHHITVTYYDSSEQCGRASSR